MFTTYLQAADKHLIIATYRSQKSLLLTLLILIAFHD